MNVIKLIVAMVAALAACASTAEAATGNSGWFYVNTSGKSSLALVANNAAYGTVSGGKEYKVGATATAKAKAKSGYVFAGWFTDKKMKSPFDAAGYDYRNPTVEFAMPRESLTLYAKFITKKADKKALKFSDATKKLATTPVKTQSGESLSLDLGLSCASLPMVSVSGLPKGLSVDLETWSIAGTAKAPGSYTATITAKSAAGNKVTQKVKFTVTVPSWAKGTFYGTAYVSDPYGYGGHSEYMKFTVGATGKVSGKIQYNGKWRSFTSAYTSCTSSKAVFSPTVKLDKEVTVKPGKVTVAKREYAWFTAVEAAADWRFAARKKPNLVKKGKALAALVGETFTVKKGKEKLTVKLGDGDAVTVSGTVNGKKLSEVSWALWLVGKEDDGSVETYTFCVDIIDTKLNYQQTVFVTAEVGPRGTTAGAAFSAE